MSENAVTNEQPIDPYSGVHLADVLREAAVISDAVIEIFNQDKQGEDRKKDRRIGVYICIAETDLIMGGGFGPPLTTTMLRFPHEEKREKYYQNSLKKTLCLRNLRVTKGHVSSYQGRNPAQGYWGGAIVVGNLVIGCSGLDERSDEAICLILAVQLKWLTATRAEEIAAYGGNAVFFRSVLASLD